ncbi:MAG: hypothetical protein HOV87_31310 [Catenulispora sp.]|nr:hypothetical protein [Catenulispora sp.]
MKYEIRIEENVPRIRELIVEVPDDHDDPAEYLRTHTDGWADPQLPEGAATIARIHAAIPPLAPDPEAVFVVEWTAAVQRRCQVLATAAELHRALQAGTGGEVDPFTSSADVHWRVRGNVHERSMNHWIQTVTATGRATTVDTQIVEDPWIHAATPATETQAAEYRAGLPQAPSSFDRAVSYDFTETSTGRGALALAMLDDSGLWDPGTPVTPGVLAEYFGLHGIDPGQVKNTDTAFTDIAYTAHRDGGRP